MRKYIIIIVAVTVAVQTFLGAADYDFDGEVKLRSQTTTTDKTEQEFDLRVQGSLLIEYDSPFFFYLALELGYINLDEYLLFTDFLDLEAKNMFLGYKSDNLESSFGIISINTPGKYVLDSESFGAEAKLDYSDFSLEGFYSLPNLIDDSLSIIMPEEDLSHILFADIKYDKMFEPELWVMYLADNSHQYYSYYSYWLGLEVEQKFDNALANFGFTYNGGEINNYEIPVSAYFTHLSAEYDLSKRSKVYSRLNSTGSFDSSDGVITQFQSALGEGSLDSDLDILYSNNDTMTLSDGNLYSEDFIFDDLGLLTYEVGYSTQFRKIPFETDIVLGAGNSGDIFDIGFMDSFLGIEIDLKNKIDITDNIQVKVNLGYLFAGDSQDIENEFSLECSLRYRF